jgi:hypothetical protein
MQKTQLVALVVLLLALVFTSSEALPCRFCDQQTCRAACLTDLKNCYQWEKDHHKKQHCLSFYYICGAGCAFSPRSAGNSPEDSPTNNEVLPSATPIKNEVLSSATPTKNEVLPSATPTKNDVLPSKNEVLPSATPTNFELPENETAVLAPSISD